MQILFFAKDNDLVEIISHVYDAIPFQAVDITSLEMGSPRIEQKLHETKNVSVANSGTLITSKSYFLIKPGTTPNTRTVELRKGGEMIVIDHITHPESVLFSPGGVWDDPPSIISGEISTICEDTWSLSLCRLFSKEMRSKFKKIDTYLVSPSAEISRKQGIRLTADIRAPIESDVGRF